MIFAFLFMLLIVAAMSVGVIMGRRPIAGSCGGMKALGLNGECQVCGGQPDSCASADEGLSRLPEARRQAAALAVDASEPHRPSTRTL